MLCSMHVMLPVLLHSIRAVATVHVLFMSARAASVEQHQYCINTPAASCGTDARLYLPAVPWVPPVAFRPTWARPGVPSFVVVMLARASHLWTFLSDYFACMAIVFAIRASNYKPDYSKLLRGPSPTSSDYSCV